MKTKYWISIIIFLLIISVISAVIVNNNRSDNVEIIQDGKVIYRYNLSDIKESSEIKIENGDKYNIIKITHGDVYISDASCKGKDCVHRGKLSDGGQPIICVPNRLIIRYTDNDYDAISG